MFGLLYALFGIGSRTVAKTQGTLMTIDSWNDSIKNDKKTFYDANGKERLTENGHRISRNYQNANGDIGLYDLTDNKMLINYSENQRNQWNIALNQVKEKIINLNVDSKKEALENNLKCYEYYYLYDEKYDSNSNEGYERQADRKIGKIWKRTSDDLEISNNCNYIAERRFYFIVDIESDIQKDDSWKEEYDMLDAVGMNIEKAKKINLDIINHQREEIENYHLIGMDYFDSLIKNKNYGNRKTSYDYDSEYLLKYAKSVGAIL